MSSDIEVSNYYSMYTNDDFFFLNFRSQSRVVWRKKLDWSKIHFVPIWKFLQLKLDLVK
mgnify:CR=1 FL=1